MPPEMKIWVRERGPKTLKEASEMADNYVAARKGIKDRRVCLNRGKAGHIARFCPVSEAKTDQKAAGEKEGVTKADCVCKEQECHVFLVERYVIMRQVPSEIEDRQEVYD